MVINPTVDIETCCKVHLVHKRITYWGDNMSEYRTNTIHIEAFTGKELCHAAENNWKALPWWIVKEYEAGNVIFKPEGVEVFLGEGWVEAGLKDYVIKDGADNITVCRENVFKVMYHQVDNLKTGAPIC